MKNIIIADITLREFGKDGSQISFREKVETAKLLHKMGVDVIETAKIGNVKTDTLFLHTIAPLTQGSVIACPIGLDESEADSTWAALKCAQKPRLQVRVPVSTVQMEYICHKKPKALAEALEKQLRHARELCPDVEFAAEDAVRSDRDFLTGLLATAVACGVSTVTLCDSEGTMLPEELAHFVGELYAAVPQLKDVTLAVECTDRMSLGTASVLSSIRAGATLMKTAAVGHFAPSLLSVSDILRLKGDSLGIGTGLNSAVLGHALTSLRDLLTGSRSATSPFDSGVREPGEDFSLNADDDINTVARHIALLGYDLTEEDLAKVYDRFRQLAEKKRIGPRELDAIVAANALQVTPTYKLESYVINCGNIIAATASVVLEKDGEKKQGISAGDGPIDAAFLAIEQIIGHHYELDDFQIQAVTEGREAVGEALVRLRAAGKLYSGRGISTDIVGASIRAYINALNKICFEINE